MPQIEMERLHSRIAHLESVIRWLLELLSISNRVLSPAEKLTLASVRFELDARKREPDRGNCTTVFIPSLEKRNGLSRQTIGATLQSLAEKGVIARESYFAKDAQGYTQIDKKRIAVAINEQFLKQPKLIASLAVPERNHGGRRVAFLCKHCRTIGQFIKPGYQCICTECGEVQFLTPASPYLLTEEQLERSTS